VIYFCLDDTQILFFLYLEAAFVWPFFFFFFFFLFFFFFFFFFFFWFFFFIIIIFFQVFQFFSKIIAKN